MQLLIDALEAAEQRAAVDIVAAAPDAARRRLDLSCERLGGAVVLSSPVAGGPLFNRAIGVPADGRLVGEIMGRYRGRGISRFLLQPALAAAGDGAFESQGLVRYRRAWAKLIRPVLPAPAVPLGPGVRRARPDDVAVCGAILAEAFDLPADAGAVLAAVVGRPRWHVYVAEVGGRPVAVGALFVDGDVGALAFAATAREARGRGAQGALIARRVLAAGALGCAWAASETGLPIADEPNPSYRNFLRAGFLVAHRRENFTLPGAGAAATAPIGKLFAARDAG